MACIHVSGICLSFLYNISADSIIGTFSSVKRREKYDDHDQWINAHRIAGRVTWVSCFLTGGSHRVRKWEREKGERTPTHKTTEMKRESNWIYRHWVRGMRAAKKRRKEETCTDKRRESEWNLRQRLNQVSHSMPSFMVYKFGLRNIVVGCEKVHSPSVSLSVLTMVHQRPYIVIDVTNWLTNSLSLIQSTPTWGVDMTCFHPLVPLSLHQVRATGLRMKR
jgi:hypothetical protein